MNTALFADIGNLYYCVGKRFDERRLDYQKLLQRAVTLTKGPIGRAVAYGSQMGAEATQFIAKLQKIGFETKYRRPQLARDRTVVKKVDWDVTICIDVVKSVSRLDAVVLCTSDSDMVPLVSWVRDQGVQCVVLACGLPRELRQVATRYYEITGDMLEGEKNGSRAA